MRGPLKVALLCLPFCGPAAAEMRWPNPQIAVPPLVTAFIVGECRHRPETAHEDLDACILGERYGYRAVVMMLMDEATGERAAERYRACRGGLGNLSGRFHRNRAACIGGIFGYKWRFEFSREAAAGAPALRDAAPARRDAPGGRRVALADR